MPEARSYPFPHGWVYSRYLQCAWHSEDQDFTDTFGVILPRVKGGHRRQALWERVMITNSLLWGTWVIEMPRSPDVGILKT